MNLAAGRIDVELYFFVGVLAVEEEQLGHDQVGHLVVDGGAQKDNPFLEQQREDIVGALAAPAGFDDHWNQRVLHRNNLLD